MRKKIEDLDARLNAIGNLMGERLLTDSKVRPDLKELVKEYHHLMSSLEYRLSELVLNYKFYEKFN